MPRIPRKLLIDPTEVGIFHCISRCVRRAFLCGDDRLSGRNFDHRKQWLQERIGFLAGQFGIDVLGFAVMSNHLHVVLRNRPDMVRGWSDEDVARRCWNVFPLRRDDEGSPAEPQEWELSMITGNPERLAEVRARLSSISWFMRCLAEPIARCANREDACTGRFWEGRYKCQPILDESALAAGAKRGHHDCRNRNPFTWMSLPLVGIVVGSFNILFCLCTPVFGAFCISRTVDQAYPRWRR